MNFDKIKEFFTGIKKEIKKEIRNELNIGNNTKNSIDFTKDNNNIHIVMILDRSGSMNGLQNDVIGGFNSFIDEQQKNSDKKFITTILFDDESSVLQIKIIIQEDVLLY
jgi:hypothetical protein